MKPVGGGAAAAAGLAGEPALSGHCQCQWHVTPPGYSQAESQAASKSELERSPSLSHGATGGGGDLDSESPGRRRAAGAAAARRLRAQAAAARRPAGSGIMAVIHSGPAWHCHSMPR